MSSSPAVFSQYRCLPDRRVGTRALSGDGAADLSRPPRPARRTEGPRTALPDTARSGGAGRYDRSRHAGGDALGLPSVGARYTQEAGQLNLREEGAG